MTNTELILSMLAEAPTKDSTTATNPEIFEASKIGCYCISTNEVVVYHWFYISSVSCF